MSVLLSVIYQRMIYNDNSEWNIDFEESEESTSDEDDEHEEISMASECKSMQASSIVQPEG